MPRVSLWLSLKALVIAESLASVWLAAQIARYSSYRLLYYSSHGREFASRWVPSAQQAIVEVPAVALGGVIAYLLVYRFARTAIRFRDTTYGRPALAAAALLSSLTFAALSIVGAVVWWLITGAIAVDWLVVAAVALLALAGTAVIWLRK